MDFGALPPEINSARMYAGAGAGPLLATAAAWNSVGVELSTTAEFSESVITQLTAEQWMGPVSLAMAAAVEPYVAWLTYTAGSAADAAAAPGVANAVAPIGGAPLVAGLGQASAVGGLSVPASWSAAAPAVTAGASALEGSGWTVAADEAAPIAGMAGMPGMAGVSGAARGAGFCAGPRYGFKPVVMPKQVVV